MATSKPSHKYAVPFLLTLTPIVYSRVFQTQDQEVKQKDFKM